MKKKKPQPGKKKKAPSANGMKDVFPLVLSILVFFAALGAYAFLYTNVNNSTERIEVALHGSETLTRRDALARSIEVFLKGVETERATLDRYVIEDEGVVDVIELVEAVADRENVGISISSVSVSGPPGWSYHERVDIILSADGTFANLTDFIATLEALPAAARVESASLERSGGSSWFASVAVTFVKEKP